jgi:hypothetical protein
MAEPVVCRRCGAATRFVIVAESRKGLLVDETPRHDYVVVGTTETGVPLVRPQETWVPHFLTCSKPR